MVNWMTQSDALGVVTTLFSGERLNISRLFLDGFIPTRALENPLEAATCLHRPRVGLANSSGRGIFSRTGIRRFVCVHGCRPSDGRAISNKAEWSDASVFDQRVRGWKLDIVQAIGQLSGAFNWVPIHTLCALQSLWIPLIHRLDSERSLRVPRGYSNFSFVHRHCRRCDHRC